MVAIYARQSIDKKDSLSIEAQIELCKINSSELSPLIYEDRGYSGKNTTRPSLQRLITDIQHNEIDTVIVYKLDRISRNITDFYKLYEIMEKHNCSFVSATESFDTSNSMGKALMGILAIFAQMERENIQKRVKDNYYYRTATSGSWGGGPAPFGFKNGRNSDNKPTLIRNEREIETVEAIFYYYAGGAHYSLSKISHILAQEGYSIGDRKSFSSVSIARILRNTVYVKADNTLYKYLKTQKINFLNPEEEWDGTKSCHIVGKKHNSNYHSYEDLSEQSVYLTNFPGFIDSYIYIQAQEQLMKNKQMCAATQEGTRLEELSGKVKCGHCGYAVKSYHLDVSGRPLLNCYGRTSLRVCEAKLNKKHKFFNLQKAIGEEIQKVLDNMSLIYKDKIDVYYEIFHQIKQLEQENDNLISLVATGGRTADKVKKHIEEREQQIYELELKAEMINKSIYALPLQLCVQNDAPLSPTGISIEYESLSTAQKKEIVNMLIDKIKLYEDGKIEIEWLI